MDNPDLREIIPRAESGSLVTSVGWYFASGMQQRRLLQTPKTSYMHILACSWMNQTEQYVELFKALSDETRLRLVVLLYKREYCVCQIEAALGISQTKASRHLAILRRAGLLKSRREGLWIYYTLAEPGSKVEANLFEVLRESLFAELSNMVDQAKNRTCNAQNATSEDVIK